MTTADDAWTKRDGPLLRIALREIEAGNDPQFEEFAAETGLDLQQVQIGMSALADAGYLDAYFTGAHSGFVVRIHERARRELGSWPTADVIAADVLTALDAASKSEKNEERRAWLSGAADIGRAVLAAEISAVLRKYGLTSNASP